MRNKPPHPPQSCPPQSSSPEHVELDSSSLFPQSLSPSHSQRLGMQRLFLHLKRSEGQVCWSVGGGTHSGPAHCPPPAPRSPRGGVTHGTARAPRRCYPGSRCPRRISSAPGCSGCSCRRTLRAGTEEGGCRRGWLQRKSREGEGGGGGGMAVTRSCGDSGQDCASQRPHGRPTASRHSVAGRSPTARRCRPPPPLSIPITPPGKPYPRR